MFKKSQFVFVLILIFVLAVSMVNAEVLHKVAILPFDDGSIDDHWWGDYDVGSGVSDELVTALLNLDPKKFRLIEREQIQRVLDEQDFGQSGRVDPRSAAKIGKILGVQYLIIGKVTEFTNKTSGGNLAFGSKGLGLKTTTSRVAIDARMVDSTTAEIVAAVTGEGEKKQSNISIDYDWNHLDLGSEEFRGTNLGKALREAVDEVAKGFGDKAGDLAPAQPTNLIGTVAYASSTRVIINIGSNEGVKEGMVFVAYHIIEVVEDPDTGEILDEVTEPIAELKVTSVKDRSATCSVVKIMSADFEIAVKDRVIQK